MYPGHMEPLGSKQPHVEIETLYEYPNAQSKQNRISVNI